MKGYKWKTGFAVLFTMAFISFLPPSMAVAFDDGVEFKAYGWLRNNYGIFTEDINYAQDQDDLATNRTWLRLYGDLKFSDKLSFFTAIQFAYEPEYDIEKGSVSKTGGKEYSEYDSVSDVIREAYIDWRPSDNHSIRAGRQIVIWGESLTTEVGDVIHPNNGRYAFAFANKEDSRIPLWMIKGLHYIDAISGSIEWIISPNLIDDKDHLVNRGGEFAQSDGHGGLNPGQRFGLHPEDRAAAGNPVIRSFGPPFPGAPFVVPFEIPHVYDEYPENTMDDLRYGFRTNTFLEGYEFGFLYWHTQSYAPVIKVGPHYPFPIIPPENIEGTQDYILTYSEIDIFGIYANKDVPVGLMRAEMIYIPDKAYGTFDPTDADAVVERDYAKYMIAWDINGFFYFPWHKSAPFDITLEHVGEWVNDEDNLQYVIYNTPVEKWTPSFNGRISTNFFYNKLATEVIFSYAPKDKSGLLMPAVTYTPSWKDKALSFQLKYIRIFGESNYSGLGMLQEKDMVLFTTQYNFDF
ncbi:DUF1302 family protein [Thermodesulfobacteriota bacterium]